MSVSDLHPYLSLPSLMDAFAIDIYGNESMLNIYMPELLSAGQHLNVFDNVSLCLSIVEELRDQLLAAGWSGSVNISGNDDGC